MFAIKLGSHFALARWDFHERQKRDGPISVDLRVKLRSATVNFSMRETQSDK